jgi:CRISPR-associated protein Cst2
VLEVSRAVSLTPWAGDVVFNSNSPWANLGAKDKDNPGIYQAEVHATRYQYGIALTPERLRDKSRAAKAINALCQLGPVAGNHGRFLFDFSPDAVVIRITSDPAPRLLYCFDTPDNGKTVVAHRLAKRAIGPADDRDIDPTELIVFGVELVTEDGKKVEVTEEGKEVKGAFVTNSVKAACAEAVKRINEELKKIEEKAKKQG